MRKRDLMILNLIRLTRRALGLIGIALSVALIGFSLFVNIVPLSGLQLFIIGGGSMEPSIPIGSLVIVTPLDAMTVVIGDVVTIRADNGVVFTHRVSHVVDLPEGRFFETKGDANQSLDGGLVPARAIVGAAQQYVPYAGYAQDFLSRVPGMIAVLAVLGALLLSYLLLEMLEEPARAIPGEAREPIGP
jgi:signal peptidase